MAEQVTGTDWSSRELDLIVSDYFDMLRKEQARAPLNKAAHRRALMARTSRSSGSIEFKHRNISAVLSRLGLPRIEGYVPAENFQAALALAIERYVEVHPEPVPYVATQGLAELPAVYEHEPPTPSPVPGAARTAFERVARKFDPALRDERNRALGYNGEKSVFDHEYRKLVDGDRRDLARRIRWVSQEDGDGLGYDILSFDLAGQRRLLEVKTTRGGATTPFYLTRTEADVARERPAEFRLFRLYDFAKAPKLFSLAPPLETALRLEPLNFRASLR